MKFNLICKTNILYIVFVFIYHVTSTRGQDWQAPPEVVRTNGTKQCSSNPGFGVCAWAKLNIEYFNPRSYSDTARDAVAVTAPGDAVPIEAGIPQAVGETDKPEEVTTSEPESYEDDTEKDNYTFVALIDIVFTDGCRRTCTGAIIHDNVVITAAHCFMVVLGSIPFSTTILSPISSTMVRNAFLLPELSLSFIVIGTKLMFHTGYEQYLPIERVVTHPNYRGWTADLALVFTFANMMSDKPGQILPLASKKSITPVDSNVTVLSWGRCKGDIDEEPEVETDTLQAKYEQNGNNDGGNDNKPPLDLHEAETAVLVQEQEQGNEERREENPKNDANADRKRKRLANLDQYAAQLVESQPQYQVPRKRQYRLQRVSDGDSDIKSAEEETKRTRQYRKHGTKRTTTPLYIGTMIQRVYEDYSETNATEMPVTRVKKKLRIDTIEYIDEPKKKFRYVDTVKPESSISQENRQAEQLQEPPTYNDGENVRRLIGKVDMPMKQKKRIRTLGQKMRRYPQPKRRRRPARIQQENRRLMTNNARKSKSQDWRRSIGQQQNNLTVGMFGYVNLGACKKIVERALPPLYSIKNSNEVLCYSSEDFYITNEDSGAPVVQGDELIAVTVGGVDSEGEHVAVGMKISCFCSWIASNLPNEGGKNMQCCTDCCNENRNNRLNSRHSRARNPTTTLPPVQAPPNVNLKSLRLAQHNIARDMHRYRFVKADIAYENEPKDYVYGSSE